MKLLIVGNDGGTNVGGSLLRGAADRGIEATLLPADDAFAGPQLLKKVSWHLLQHRPLRLTSFSKRVVDTAKRHQVDAVVFTGIAPCDAGHLLELRKTGIRTANYLTDNPFNPAHRASWFLRSLPHFDAVFSPRRAPMSQLLRMGCTQVSYLPFAYDPHLFVAAPRDPNQTADVIFVGGADDDRMSLLSALMKSGMRVALLGDYWDRDARTAPASRGHATPAVIGRAVSQAAVALCIPRRANRDGHTMWTFEAAALGACLLVERTEEHVDLFGPENEAVTYFTDADEIVTKARRLLEHPDDRRRLAAAAHSIVTRGGHTYADRLQTMVARLAGE